MKQIVTTRRGGPEVLALEEAPTPAPRAGEVRIRTALAGVNFADVMVRLGLYPDSGNAEEDRRQRADEAALLLDRLRAEGLLGEAEGDEERAAALHRYLARSACELAAVQLDDLAGELEQANLPGTVAEHPNWRRRCSRTIDAVTKEPRAGRLLAIMRAERPRRETPETT